MQFAKCRQSNKQHLLGGVFRSRGKMKRDFSAPGEIGKGRKQMFFEYQLRAKHCGWHFTKILSFGNNAICSPMDGPGDYHAT